MSRILDLLLDAKHKISGYIEPIQTQINTYIEDIDPSSSSHTNEKPLRQNPSIYSSFCANYRSQSDVCGLCSKVCPQQAIDFTDNAPHISNRCIQCDICCAVCPTETIVSQTHKPLDVIGVIGKNSGLYNTSYIACDRSDISNYPNVYKVPCIASISRAQWTFIMNRYPNVCIYIPHGLCDGCDVCEGEAIYRAEIKEAEKYGKYPLSLIRDNEQIDTRLKPYLEREQLAVSVSKNQLEPQTRMKVLNDIDLEKRLYRYVESAALDRCGRVNSQKIQRRITSASVFDLLSSYYNEDIVGKIHHRFPKVDPYRCTGCEKCSKTCPQAACSIDRRGNFSVCESICVGCGACVRVCEESALTMICKKF